jgi:hypothetical protein
MRRVTFEAKEKDQGSTLLQTCGGPLYGAPIWPGITSRYRFLRRSMVVLLNIHANCSLFAPKPANPSRLLPLWPLADVNLIIKWADCEKV